MNLQSARRCFLRHAAFAASAVAVPRWAWSNPPSLQANPFALGVASGDPAPDGVVLWTRLALANPAQMQASHTVRWEVAHDGRFAQIVQKGEATAVPALGHSVHVELRGLAPGRWYHYRFMLGDAISATGRTRTAPAPGEMPAALRIAFIAGRSVLGPDEQAAIAIARERQQNFMRPEKHAGLGPVPQTIRIASRRLLPPR